MQEKSRTAIVTGATSGIGLAVAARLLRKEWRVALVALNHHELSAVKAKLQEQMPGAVIDIYAADLSLNNSRKSLAGKLAESYTHIDLLINNAGAIFPDYELTEDGVERTFALNHLGYFHLTLLLMPLLQKAASASILNVTSRNHLEGAIDFKFITGQSNQNFAYRFNNWLKRPWKQKVLYTAFGEQAMAAYSQSKLANVLFTCALAQKLTGSHVTINCIHPGMVKTNIAASVKSPLTRLFWQLAMHAKAITAEESAGYIMDALSEIELKKRNGVYFELNRIAIPHFSVNDEYLQKLLWDKSAVWCGLDVTVWLAE